MVGAGDPLGRSFTTAFKEATETQPFASVTVKV
jgi:hypothetical protein